MLRLTSILFAIVAASASAQEAAPAVAAAPVPTLAVASSVKNDGLSSHRDPFGRDARDAPITCKPGDLVRQPGKTLGELFGADWPPLPAAAAAEAKTPPRLLKIGRLSWPAGLEGKRALVVLAILLGPEGKPLRAEPLCATTNGFDHMARHAVMTGTYEAALVNGQPVTTAVVVVVPFNPSRHRPANHGNHDSASGS